MKLRHWIGAGLILASAFAPAHRLRLAAQTVPGTIPPTPTSNGTIPEVLTPTPVKEGTPFPPAPPITPTPAPPTATPIVFTPTLGSWVYMPIVAGDSTSTMELKGLSPIPEPAPFAPLAPCRLHFVSTPPYLPLGRDWQAVAVYAGPQPGEPNCNFGGFFSEVDGNIITHAAQRDGRAAVGYYIGGADDWRDCSQVGHNFTCTSVVLDRAGAIVVVNLFGRNLGTAPVKLTQSGATVYNRNLTVFDEFPGWLPFVESRPR